MRAVSRRIQNVGNTWITAPFENVSERNNTLHVFNTNDETRDNNPDEVIELSVPGAHFDRQSNTHHKRAELFFYFLEINKQKILIRARAMVPSFTKPSMFHIKGTFLGIKIS